MDLVLRAHQRACLGVVYLLLRLALFVDTHRRRMPRRVRRWRGSLRRIVRLFRVEHRRPPGVPLRPGRKPWNRTPEPMEEKVVRLHVEQPRLGAGQLRHLAERVLGFRAARETFRRILIRRRDLVRALEEERRRRPRRIRVTERQKLWGADLTLVWVLGLWTVWILGVVDYHGSRLVAFERLRLWPTARQIAAVLDRAMDAHGAPERLLTDRGPQFRADLVEDVLARRGVHHVLTRPAHPWTNGRIERIFGTFKREVVRLFWLLRSARQVDRLCADFLTYYNRHRPHSAYGGLTPEEVHLGRKTPSPATGRVTYFEGHLHWYRFG